MIAPVTRFVLVWLALVAGCHHSSMAVPDPDAAEVDAAVPDAPPIPIPIKHVVVIVKENHTFDNYFGSFPGADGIAQIQTPHGTITPPHAPDRTPRDLCHAARLRAHRLQRRRDERLGSGLGLVGQRRRPRVRAVPRGRHPELLAVRAPLHARRSVLRRTSSARASPATRSCSPRRSAGRPATPTRRSRTRTGAAIRPRARASPIENQTTCQDEQVFPCFDIPSIPDVLPHRRRLEVLRQRTSTCCPRSGRCSTRSQSIRNGPGWANVVNASDVR